MIQSTHLEKLVTREPESRTEFDKEAKIDEAKKIDTSKQDESESKNGFTTKSVIKAIEATNKELEPSGKKLAYSIHERTNQILIKVIDIETNEVIKEIPDEKLMDIMADVCKASGLLIDEKI